MSEIGPIDGNSKGAMVHMEMMATGVRARSAAVHKGLKVTRLKKPST